MRIFYLTENEEKAVRLLAEDHSYYTLREKCLIPLAGMGVFTQTIRRKTGIRDTKNYQECKDYITMVEDALADPVLNEQQMRAIRMVVRGETEQGICYQLQLERNSFRNFLDKACEAIGIFTLDTTMRRAQMRTFLAIKHPPHFTMTPLQERILRLVASGKKAIEIADTLNTPVEFIRYTIKSSAIQMGMSARGRDVQRNMIRAYFEEKDAKRAALMDDPAF